jgi:hypothetical protein
MTKTNSEAVEKIIEIRTASELAWEGACAEDECWRAPAENCDEHYGDALRLLEEGNIAMAELSLMAANNLESEGGDNSHAHAALKIVRELLD